MMKTWCISTILSLGLFCVSPKSGNVCSLLVILYLFISMLTLMYLKKLDSHAFYIEKRTQLNQDHSPYLIGIEKLK